MMAISAELLVGMLALPAIAAASSLPAHAAAAIENKRLGSENEIAGLVGGIRDQEKETRIGPCDLRIRERAWRREGNPARNRSIDRSDGFVPRRGWIRRSNLQCIGFGYPPHQMIINGLN
jgi:hypothetical protein